MGFLSHYFTGRYEDTDEMHSMFLQLRIGKYKCVLLNNSGEVTLVIDAVSIYDAEERVKPFLSSGGRVLSVDFIENGEDK